MTVESQGTETTTEAGGGNSAAESTGNVPAAESAGGNGADQLGETSGAASAPTLPPAYQPNFKFKVFNEEKEFDPWLKEAIKDAETEKKARELYEKAHGLDYVKNDRHRLKEELGTLKQTHTKAVDVINQADMFMANKDYDSLFKFMNIPDHELFNYVKSKLDALETPEKQAAYQRDVEARQTQYNLQSQNRSLETGYQQLAVEAKTREMNWVLERPEVSQAVQAFDQRYGQPGAFEAEVIRRGQYHWITSQKDMPVEDVVKEVLHLAGLTPGSNAAPSQQQVGAAPQAPVTSTAGAPVIPAQGKPTIPNIQGRGTSPTRKEVQSLADLKKRRDELASMS